MIWYNYGVFYSCFNNPFLVDYGTFALNIPIIPIDGSPHPKRISWYTSDPLPAAISVTYGNYFSMLTTPSGSPQLFEPHHTIMSYSSFSGRTKRGYCSMLHGGQICYKTLRLYCSKYSINKIYYYCRGPDIMCSYLRAWFFEHFCCISLNSVYWCVCTPFSALLKLLNFLRLFSSWFIDTTMFLSFYIICLKLPPFIAVILCLYACCDSPIRKLLCTGYLHVYDRNFLRAWSDAKIIHLLWYQEVIDSGVDFYVVLWLYDIALSEIQYVMFWGEMIKNWRYGNTWTS